jgi:ectoine hydroxylase-related dioxygenase (phytanoyl-CoA dioxygenase family)
VNPRAALEEKGYAIAAPVLAERETAAIERSLGRLPSSGAGTRNLLDLDWCRETVALLHAAPGLQPLLPDPLVAVQCTLFDKTPRSNWLVALHQDLTIPVDARVEHPVLGAWSMKEGRHFVQPPDEVLDGLIAVRVHIDACGADNGPLRVVPGSHREGRLDAVAARALRDRVGEVECPVERGGALAFKPLLLHASSKSSSPRHRRVLHFLFAPPAIGFGLRWALAV